MAILLKKDKNCNAIVHLLDGSKLEISADQLYDKNLHYWQGWHCNVGVDSIFIDNDYTVYAGQCRNDKLGNLFDNDFKFFEEPTICKQISCTPCATDLYSHKFKGKT